MDAMDSREKPIRHLKKNTVISEYKLVKLLGNGQSAEVWKAELVLPINGIDLNKGDSVAIKFYKSFLLEGFEPLRIHREFSVAARLDHVNLAKVYDLVISPSRPFNTFMAMEYIDGPTLRKLIEKRGKLKLEDIYDVGMQLFSALAELHSMSALHRDVKAANIMVVNKPGNITIKLVDLGIVSIANEANLSQRSAFLGSKHSAPLEQLKGEELDERTDIYGAGSVLYHCIRGVPMYDGVGPEGAIVDKMRSYPEKIPFYDSTPQAERKLYEFVNQCISVEKDNRPSSAEECIEVIRELKKMSEGSSVIATVDPFVGLTLPVVRSEDIYNFMEQPIISSNINITSGSFFGFFQIISERDKRQLAINTNAGAVENGQGHELQLSPVQQEWMLINTGNGYWFIISKGNYEALDVYRYSKEEGAQVILWALHGGDNQNWKIEKNVHNSFSFIGKQSGKYLTANGNMIQQASRNNGPEQQWSLIPVSHSFV